MTDVTIAPNTWRLCSICKTPIGFGRDYYVCSVSTCNRQRTGLVFCAMACWAAHVPTMGHRDPWAEERRAPGASSPGASSPGASSQAAPAPGRAGLPPAPSSPPQVEHIPPARRRAASSVPAGPAAYFELQSEGVPQDVLVVVSKLKAYIRARSGMNTSGSANEALSDLMRGLCDEAIQRAAADERKTVMGRDFSEGS
jgi:hypothetical protein